MKFALDQGLNAEQYTAIGIVEQVQRGQEGQRCFRLKLFWVHGKREYTTRSD
jgi:hypothetical protein